MSGHGRNRALSSRRAPWHPSTRGDTAIQRGLGGAAMVEPIYIPVLPTRRDAWNAYAQLDFRLRRRVAPLWTVVPHSGPERVRGEPSAPDWDSDQTALDRWLTPRT